MTPTSLAFSYYCKIGKNPIHYLLSQQTYLFSEGEINDSQTNTTTPGFGMENSHGIVP